ncbi:alkylhydroperoxidase AhpD family core domain-containing protein [Parasphingorhabdus marina DSM 22363]|uniref:Alkylhydroperoxidase AhpD family core domain-containing protein n=1 Tax=Parasphingorhabdus marina DSM 22363 TaxID=1123272 RepID=A0A1N6HKY5_9SPHN|nr:carboxymuconolactone decarboxylase family protein [Parasphingorhabdus marina]SIO20417.1 alkylhydroperoxidase AhpD family core domain-containing protein [Parasphingorhabdus marina DSM 22363]
MGRISKLPPEKWDPRIRAAVQPENLTDLEQGLTRFFAHCPEQALGLMQFGGALKMNRQLPERLVELVRLRIAFFNQCRSCMAIRYSDAVADGVDEDAVCSLEKPQEAENLSDAEKAAIRFGELMATDHLAITDSIYAGLREHFSEEQIVELGMTCAFFVGFGRLAATWHMVEELPEAFQKAEEIAPWGEDKIQVR